MEHNSRADRNSTAVVAERRRREDLWFEIKAAGAVLTAGRARDAGIYGGAQGTWVDKARTVALTSDGSGVTVGLLHTGRHYADDLSDDGLIYHYPRTRRPASRDANEVAATKNASELGIPVFVITRAPQNQNLRSVRFGWIEDWDDSNRLFLVTFGDTPPNVAQPENKETPFALIGQGGAPRKTAERPTRPGRQRFKFQALQRYGGACAVCKVSVVELLDAAHLCPKSAGGTDDPRNSLILCATHHRAFDAKHFAINPETLDICVRPKGPSEEALHITYRNIAHLKSRPHSTALDWVWQKWQKFSVEPE